MKTKLTDEPSVADAAPAVEAPAVDVHNRIDLNDPSLTTAEAVEKNLRDQG